MRDILTKSDTQSSVDITPNQLDREIIQSILDQPHEYRVYNPLRSGPDATGRLLDVREEWADEGSTVVFTSGVFDLMHINHRAYLLQVKLEAMPLHFDRHWAENVGKQWDELSPELQKLYSKQALSDGSLRLVVSIDGDAAVATRKGNHPNKGGVRPVYSWETRSRDVLNATVNGDENSFWPIVDAVTIHDDQHAYLTNTPHQDIMSIAEYIQPDVWGVYDESTDIIDFLRGGYAKRFSRTQAVVLSVHDYYKDEKLGGGFSTSAVARRLGAGAAAACGVSHA